jgi:hypothetical protein
MDEKPNEGNLQTGGEPNANSTSSQGQGQPLEANLAKTIADLQRKIDSQDGEIRALKSGKDKAVTRVEKSQEEMLAKLASYLGVDENKVREAQRLSVIDELVSERLGGSQTASTIQGRVEDQGVPAGTRSFDVSDAISEVEKYELSPNEADFIALMRDKNLTKEKVQEYILRKVKPQKPVSEAGVIQPAATGGIQPADLKTLTDNYIKDMRAAAGPGKAALRNEIKNNAIKAGVNIHNIDFS